MKQISLNGGCYRSAETDNTLRDLHNCTDDATNCFNIQAK